MVNNEVPVERVRFEDEDFGKWKELHSELETRLETFKRLRFLTSEEELEKKRLQKQKLAAKDRMQIILHRHQQSL